MAAFLYIFQYFYVSTFLCNYPYCSPLAVITQGGSRSDETQKPRLNRYGNPVGKGNGKGHGGTHQSGTRADLGYLLESQ